MMLSADYVLDPYQLFGPLSSRLSSTGINVHSVVLFQSYTNLLHMLQLTAWGCNIPKTM